MSTYILDYLLGRESAPPEPTAELLEHESDSQVIADHQRSCRVDGFCYTCQCL